MDDRISKLQCEIVQLISLAEDCVYLRVEEHSVDSLHLIFSNPFEEQCTAELVFNFSTSDYPDGTIVSHSSPEVAMNTESKPLLELVATKCYDWCQQNDLEVPLFAYRIKENIMAEAHHIDSLAFLNTQISKASTEYTSDTDMDEYDNYDGFGEDSNDESSINPILEKEIWCVQRVFGENSIENRIHAGIDEMDLFFNIDLNDFLDSYTGSAWGVNFEQPLVILLHIRSISKYLDGVEPQVEVFQESQKSKGEKIKVGISLQMKKIMEMFVSHQWKDLKNSAIEEIMKKIEQNEGTRAVISAKKKERFIPDFPRQSSVGAQISLLVHNTGALEKDKAIPSIENGFLVQFLQYALNRIHSLNEYCVICDERHILETGLLKPCVCTRELCVFAFQTLGVMANAAEAIATDGDVVDLLIAMANAAANSPRNNLILDPYPSIVDPENSAYLALDPKAKDFGLVQRVLDDVVKCREMLLKGRDIQKCLDSHHRLAFPLMQWIIATCRAHIVLLPEHRQMKAMGTKYQFLLISSPPTKEKIFRTAKEKDGSTFAFHGSGIENWHSITRKGLMNASGTKYQMHGAAHGNGVYLSPNSNVSFGYTSGGIVSSRSPGAITKLAGSKKECLAGKLNLRCLALCEVVTSSSLKKKAGIWVCSNSDYVCTRFFFVYDKSTSISTSTETVKFKQEIEHAMAYMKDVKGIT